MKDDSDKKDKVYLLFIHIVILTTNYFRCFSNRNDTYIFFFSHNDISIERKEKKERNARKNKQCTYLPIRFIDIVN